METKVPVALLTPLVPDAESPLVRRLGKRRVRALESAFLHDMWSSIGEQSWTRRVLVSPEHDRTEMPGMRVEDKLWSIESVGDIGHRLENLFARLAHMGRGGLLLGAMTPGLPHAHWNAAREAISVSDAVVGPSLDGGLYLLGFSRPVRGILDRLPWGANDLARAVVDRLLAADFSVALLAPWVHVSHPSDLVHLRRSLLSKELTAPNAERLLVKPPTLLSRVRDEALDRWDRVRADWTPVSLSRHPV
jgi:glycosyltransferase A (GT-A) superfamily protein (DUF2064 family)